MGKFVDKKYFMPVKRNKYCKKCGVKLGDSGAEGSWHYYHNICIFCTNKARLEGRSDMRNG